MTIPMKITPLLEKAIEVRFCVWYLNDKVKPWGDATFNFTTRCVVAEHLKMHGVSPIVIRSLIPDPDAWGFQNDPQSSGVLSSSNLDPLYSTQYIKEA
jgi:hypothetical protein